MTIRELFHNMRYIIDQKARTAFSANAVIVRTFDLDSHNDMCAYAEMRMWCRKKCQFKWRCIPSRLNRSVSFEFENSDDADMFDSTYRA